MRNLADSRRLVTAALLLVILGSLARSIEQGRWTEGLHVLFPIAMVGVITGVLLAGSRLGTIRAHLLGVILGAVVVTWETGSLLPPDALRDSNRFIVMWERFRTWLQVVLEGGASYDALLFVLTMGAIIWFLAYNSAWFVLRYGWVWWALLPTGLVLIVNLSYVMRPDTRPFIIFLLAGMLLMLHTRLTENRARWEHEGLGYDPGLAPRFLMFGGMLSLALLVLAWQGPSRSLATTARALFERTEKPWEQVQDRWESAFAFLYPGSGPGASGLGGGFTAFNDDFELGGPLRLGNRTVFTADNAEAQQYWRAKANDLYTGRGWSINEDFRVYPDNGTVRNVRLIGPANQDESRFPEGTSYRDQTVTVMLPTGRLVFAADTPVEFTGEDEGRFAGQNVEWRLGARKVSARTPVFGAARSGTGASPAEAELADFKALIRRIGPERVREASGRAMVLQPRPVEERSTRPGRDRDSSAGIPAVDATAEAERWREIERLHLRQDTVALETALRELKQKGIAASYAYRPNARPTVEYTYYAPNDADVLNFTSTRPIGRNATYEVRSLVARPTDSQLNASKRSMPAWVTERYLQLPDDGMDGVRRLTLRLTRNAETNHQKAQAIERYLRGFKYTENSPVPPAGRDFVDYFLFDVKQGYCTSFSSAMAVMLRSINIPARIVRGFAPGEFDGELSQYVITQAQAHMWPQVYYPEYGWINYEPTPIRDLVSRAPFVGADASTDPSQVNGSQTGVGRPDLEARLDGSSGGGVLESGVPAPVRFLIAAVLVVLVAAALLALLGYGVSLIRLRGLSGARRQYAKLLQVGTLLGMRPATSHTPGEYGARLEGVIPRSRESVRSITGRYVAEVFGRQQADASALDREWRVVASEAARRVPGRWIMTARRAPAAVRAVRRRVRD